MGNTKFGIMSGDNEVIFAGIKILRMQCFSLPLLYILRALYGKSGIYLLQPLSDFLSFLFAVAIVYRRYSSALFSSALNAG